MEVIQNRWREGLGAMQWFVFLLANAVALPVVLGQIFHLTVDELAGLMQRTFFVVGLTSFIQGFWGHRLPIADGPAGSWLGVFVILGNAAIQQGHDLLETLQILQGGMLVAGLLLFVFGITGMIQRMLSFFTPLVTGSFLLLLAIQLSGVFLKGMMGVHGESPQVDEVTALIAFGVFLLVIGLSVRGRGWIKSYAVLIGILAGWIAFYAVGKGAVPIIADSGIQMPEILAWGWPQWNQGMAVSAVLLSLILVSNTVAAVSAVGQAVNRHDEPDKKALNRGGWAGGIAHMICSAFSTVGIVPLPVSAGFIRLTGQYRMRPFLIACVVLSCMALIPSVISYLALLPGPVAYAALMASFVQLIGIGLQAVLRDSLDQRKLTILGSALLLGVGVMFLPTTILQDFPSVIQYVFGNGLLVGTVIVMVLEMVWPVQKEQSSELLDVNSSQQRVKLLFRR